MYNGDIMLTGINCKEYNDYLKYYSNFNMDITKFKILPEESNGNDKVININLNLFLRILGASNEIIEDDYKTLQFMFYIKLALEEFKCIKHIIE